MISGLLLNENLSAKLCTPLSLFGNVTHISHHRLQHVTDKEIWRFAGERNNVILTKDSDYFYMSQLLGCPPKVIRLNCGNKTTKDITGILLSKEEAIRSFIESENCYFEIVGE